jgi:MEMO1 family protein
VLRFLWDLPDTIFLISSDLSHFLNYETARQIDSQTTEKILAKDYRSLDHNLACGCTPIQGLLAVARQDGLQVSLLKQCNSGDTAGDKSRVVGYGAYAVY